MHVEVVRSFQREPIPFKSLDLKWLGLVGASEEVHFSFLERLLLASFSRGRRRRLQVNQSGVELEMRGSSLVRLKMGDDIHNVIEFVNSNNKRLKRRGRELREDAIDFDEASLTHVVHPVLD